MFIFLSPEERTVYRSQLAGIINHAYSIRPVSDGREYEMTNGSTNPLWERFLTYMGSMTVEQYALFGAIFDTDPRSEKKWDQHGQEAFEMIQLLYGKFTTINVNEQLRPDEKDLFSIKWTANSIRIHCPDRHKGLLIGTGGKNRREVQRALYKLFGPSKDPYPFWVFIE
jgi:hypothetical protein